MKIFLNPQYALRNEANCSYLAKIERKEHRISREDYESIAPVTPMPPIFGYIISRINGNDLNEAISAVHEELQISKDKIYEFVMKLLDNEHPYKMKLQSSIIIFPPYILIRSKNKAKVITYKDFHPLDKFIEKRPSFPLFMNLMITSKCQTDCVYCYADRSRKDDLGTEVILKIIEQAYNEGLIYMNVSGGDIFAMKEWRKILQKISEYDFYPFLSTKIPLQENDIEFLKEIGVTKIQFSIDSFLPEEIKLNIKRDERYIEKVQRTFALLQKYRIRLGVRSVLTKYNSSLKSIMNTLRILEKYNNTIETWDITPAFYSEFRGNYENYQPTDYNLRKILDFITGTKSSIPINKKNLENKLNYRNINYKDDYHFVHKNKTCIANTYSMFVMSNGKTTLCELLYYNQDFYTGDIQKNSLKEIWNSEKSLNLFTPTQETMINTEGNPCYSCSLFEKCKAQIGKKICYVDIIKAYGPKKYDYPDPRCPKAPAHNPDLLLY